MSETVERAKRIIAYCGKSQPEKPYDPIVDALALAEAALESRRRELKLAIDTGDMTGIVNVWEELEDINKAINRAKEIDA